MVLCNKKKNCFIIVVRQKKKERVKLIVLNFLIHTLIHSSLRTVQFDNPIVSHCVSQSRNPKKIEKKTLQSTYPTHVPCLFVFSCLDTNTLPPEKCVIHRHTRCKLWDKTNTKIPIAKISL